MVTQFLPLFLKAIGATIIVALGASIIGFTGGLCIGLLTSSKMRIVFLSRVLDVFVLIIRGTPAYVQLLIVYYVIPEIIGINLSPLAAGIIALGLNETAYCGEIVRGGMQALPHGQWEACHVLGYSRFVMVKDIILPQVIRAVLPALSNDLVTLLKDTSLVSVIGLIEITQVGKNLVSLTLKPLEGYMLVAGMYFALTSGIIVIIHYLGKRVHHD